MWSTSICERTSPAPPDRPLFPRHSRLPFLIAGASGFPKVLQNRNGTGLGQLAAKGFPRELMTVVEVLKRRLVRDRGRLHEEEVITKLGFRPDFQGSRRCHLADGVRLQGGRAALPLLHHSHRAIHLHRSNVRPFQERFGPLGQGLNLLIRNGIGRSERRVLIAPANSLTM